MYMSGDNKPIGWWLKEVDRLLEQSFEQFLADDGLTRRQWQVLNAAAGGTPGGDAGPNGRDGASEPGGGVSGAIAAALAPFLGGEPAELAAVTEPLVQRGWLVGETLTAAGEDALRGLAEKVQEQRRRVAAGISEAEYVATVDVLRRMAGNLT
ncbi:MarR family winged helix-turn-helix transcriptional regulator [Kribbella sp. NPDC003557]|uniref:MarR family winged helix-turn-helix transcriptional regulator n=1 Tax=Kribbella sp. NPDC003557 TaxID=3154449 RepID=UPI0033AF7528